MLLLNAYERYNYLDYMRLADIVDLALDCGSVLFYRRGVFLDHDLFLDLESLICLC